MIEQTVEYSLSYYSCEYRGSIFTVVITERYSIDYICAPFHCERSILILILDREWRQQSLLANGFVLELQVIDIEARVVLLDASSTSLEYAELDNKQRSTFEYSPSVSTRAVFISQTDMASWQMLQKENIKNIKYHRSSQYLLLSRL
jgi:hypothetical protein